MSTPLIPNINSMLDDLEKRVKTAGKAVGRFGVDVLQGTARSGASLGLQAMNKPILTNQELDPYSLKAKNFIFGQEPLKSAGQRIKETTQTLRTKGLPITGTRVPGNVAPLLAGLGVMGTIGGDFMGGGGKKKAVSGVAKNVAKKIDPEDIKIMNAFMDKVRLKKEIPNALGELSEKLMDKFKIGPDQSLDKIADRFEDVLRGKIKTAGTKVKINPKNVPIDFVPTKMYPGTKVSQKNIKYPDILGFKNTKYLTPIEKNGKVVGGIDSVINRYNPESLTVNYVRIIPEEQGKGLGTKAIQKLFNDNPKINQIDGHFTAESKSFWEKLGAKLNDNSTTFTISRDKIIPKPKSQPRYTKGDGGLKNEIMKQLNERRK